MQGWEAGVGPAALELHKQGFFGRAGEVPRAFEGAVSATRTLFLLEEKVKITLSNYCQELRVCKIKMLPFILPFSKCFRLDFRTAWSDTLWLTLFINSSFSDKFVIFYLDLLLTVARVHRKYQWKTVNMVFKGIAWHLGKYLLFCGAQGHPRVLSSPWGCQEISGESRKSLCLAKK